MNIKDLHPDDLIGAVKLGSVWRFFAGTVAEWILDYATYDPGFDPSASRTVFRGNILRVDASNAVAYLQSMGAYELSCEDIRVLVERDGPSNWPIYVVVDFDEKLYVNGFSEIPLHQYIPSTWRGIEDTPLKYLPTELANCWVGKVV